MNHTSTIAALREIADTLDEDPAGDSFDDQDQINGSALRLRDIADTLERQGGPLTTVVLAERLEAAAQAINAAAERLEALTAAPPDLDAPGLAEDFTSAVRRILTDDYQEIIARGDRPERVAAVARAVPVADPATIPSWTGDAAPIVSRTTERHTVHADGSETHEHYVDDGSEQAVYFAPANATPGTPWPDVIGERLAKASIPATTDTIAAFLEGRAFQMAMEVPTIKVASDLYDNLEREHAAALRGEHNAPPPVVTSRAVTWPDPMAGGDDVPPRWSPIAAAALSVPVPPAPSALQALADSRRPIPGEALGMGPGDFVSTHLGPPLPTKRYTGWPHEIYADVATNDDPVPSPTGEPLTFNEVIGPDGKTREAPINLTTAKVTNVDTDKGHVYMLGPDGHTYVLRMRGPNDMG